MVVKVQAKVSTTRMTMDHRESDCCAESSLCFASHFSSGVSPIASASIHAAKTGIGNRLSILSAIEFDVCAMNKVRIKRMQAKNRSRSRRLYGHIHKSDVRQYRRARPPARWWWSCSCVCCLVGVSAEVFGAKVNLKQT